MLKTAARALTLEEFLQQPETEPASEYIDGRILQKPISEGKHSLLRSEILEKINTVTESKRIAYTFPELRCTFGGSSVVPDIVVLEWDKIPLDESGEIQNIITVPPDWIIEILSPDQKPTKVINKILHCLNHGTSLGWMIDPDEKTIVAFPPGQQPRGFDEDGDIVPVLDGIEGLELTLGQVFGWLKL